MSRLAATPPTILLVGASRGLGLGLADGYLAAGWRVIATRRGAAVGLAALTAGAEDRLLIESLEVTDDTALAALRSRLAGEALDLLFVSAGLCHPDGQSAATMAAADFNRIMLTNALAPMRIIETCVDLVNPRGTIVAMSSILGSVGANATGGLDIYRASKAALNTMLRSFSARHPRRSVVAMHPGWVETDMGGPGASVGMAESVSGMMRVIAARAGQPGCVFLDHGGETIPW